MVDATAWWPNQAMQTCQNLQVQQMQTQAGQAQPANLQTQQPTQPQQAQQAPQAPQAPVQQAMLQVMAQAQAQPQNQIQVQMHQSQMQQQAHMQQVQLQAQMQQAAQMQSQMQQMPLQQLPLQPVQQNHIPDQTDKKIFQQSPFHFQVTQVSDDSQPKTLFNTPAHLALAKVSNAEREARHAQQEQPKQSKQEPQAGTTQKQQQYQQQHQPQQRQQGFSAQPVNRSHAHAVKSSPEMDTKPSQAGKLRTRRKEPGAKAASDHAKLFQTLRSNLEVGDEKARLDAIQQIQGNVVALATESESSSRAVQMALKVATRQTATELSSELTGHIAEVALSLHGNHVLQRVIEVLPSSKTNFIAEELVTRAAEVARNVFGCRIFCRLLEQSANLTSTQRLLAKVIRDAEDLVQNQFGRYVAQAVLEHGTDEQRRVASGS
ncbi:APUM5 [Symbiodinium natans]|uniref:APUM5 protein n=1 Tax=Symbiodinium natans TaxID=878477 RepID=A0A812RGT8_9DINO|nr:APUM5 [Symbiodinium natans]